MLMKKLFHLSASAWLLCIFLSSCFTSRQHASTAGRRHSNGADDGLFSRKQNRETEDEGYVPSGDNTAVYVSFTKSGYKDHPDADDAPVAPKERLKDDSHPLPKNIRKKYAQILGIRYKDIDNPALYRFI